MANKPQVIKGAALFAKIFDGQQEKWDQGRQSYVKAPDGSYTINLVLSQVEAAELCDDLETKAKKVAEDTIKQQPKLKKDLAIGMPFDDEYDKEGNATGNVVFKFKTSAMINGNPKKLMVVDAKRKPMMDSGIEVGNGSKVNVAFTVSCNYIPAQKKVFATLYLSAIQVLELVEYNAGSGMFEDEDGFVAEAVEKDDRHDIAPFDTEEDNDGSEGDF